MHDGRLECGIVNAQKFIEPSLDLTGQKILESRFLVLGMGMDMAVHVSCCEEDMHNIIKSLIMVLYKHVSLNG